MQQDISVWVTCARQVTCHIRRPNHRLRQNLGLLGRQVLCSVNKPQLPLALVHKREFNKNTRWYRSLPLAPSY